MADNKGDEEDRQKKWNGILKKKKKKCLNQGNSTEKVF